ncbi:MAG: peptidoglycan recognition family protein [Phycisphaerales bacterium]|jgi:hypothetical protein
MMILWYEIKRRMFNRVSIFLVCLLLLSGCAYNNEPAPEIVHSPASTFKLIPPRIVVPEQDRQNKQIPRDWLPPSRLEHKWTAIVIHHSATMNGNAAIFNRMHKEERHWEGVGYDFVIGNGTDSGDGQVEVTFRWRKQIAGAHCGGTLNNWANKEAIGICLVGDFNRTVPTTRQMQSLSKLVNFLQKRYRISSSRIFGHNSTPGARVTDCPGEKFPMAKLKTMLNF